MKLIAAVCVAFILLASSRSCDAITVGLKALAQAKHSMNDFLTYSEYQSPNDARTLTVVGDVLTVCEDTVVQDGSFVKDCFRRNLDKLTVSDPMTLLFTPELKATDTPGEQFKVEIQEPQKCRTHNGLLCAYSGQKGQIEYLFLTPYFFKQANIGDWGTLEACAGEKQRRCCREMAKLSGIRRSDLSGCPSNLGQDDFSSNKGRKRKRKNDDDDDEKDS